ncbi:uncharacterized protein LOC121052306 [Rosa chinensis]|uniref:uncharacterized protein LOC121052306 n=1 Tax=Rosa chinensis TaxID=74649 RepID=UPI001AD94A8D|nr:uncharacterized protein LOC121052306 [Rosa chinensis]
MTRFGFARGWISMVMQCVSTVQYSFFIRGRPRGYVSPSRGLRQGDPLSPYLFLLGAEGFLALLQKSLVAGTLPGIAVCPNAPPINHLLFADDSMLYARASLEACSVIQEVLETYRRAYGQVVNFAKSSVVFSKNVPVDIQDDISGVLRVEVVESHAKYLGLPTYVGCKKTATFQYIKERLSKSLLHGTCARFWWGSTLDKRKIHWKNWNALCNPKEDGGLGFRSLSNFNSAMLAKQAWRIVNHPSTLVARIYKARYFPDTSFWEVTSHASPSYSWRSIFSTRDMLKDSCYWQVGNGENIDIYSDLWVVALPLGRPIPSGLATVEVSKVHELLSGTGGWNIPLLQEIFTGEEATAVATIPLSRRAVIDRLCWKLSKDGKFSERNDRVWNQKRCEARDVSLGIVSRLQEFTVHNLKPYQPKVKRGAVWKAPPVGVVKVNVDGAFHHTSRKGGLGFVFRNENGIMLGGGSWPLSGLNSPKHVEILACKVALEFAEVHGFGPVILETDALEVQCQLSLHDSVNLSGLGRIYDDVVALLEAHSVIQVTHVGRKEFYKLQLQLTFVLCNLFFL